jgi:NhaA family Na+:H+ antiporter
VALVGRHLPVDVRIFVLTLAVADDIASVVVLSLRDLHAVRWLPLLLALVVTLGISRSTFLRQRAWWLVLVVMWLLLAWAHVEPPLAGVAAGFLVAGERQAIAERLALLQTLSVWWVLPLFIGVSCAVPWGWQGSFSAGLLVVRVVGKFIGISLGALSLRRLRPQWWWILPTAMICSVGITVPLIFAHATFGQSATYDAAVGALLVASVCGAVVGTTWLAFVSRARSASDT